MDKDRAAAGNGVHADATDVSRLWYDIFGCMNVYMTCTKYVRVQVFKRKKYFSMV